MDETTILIEKVEKNYHTPLLIDSEQVVYLKGSKRIPTTFQLSTNELVFFIKTEKIIISMDDIIGAFSWEDTKFTISACIKVNKKNKRKLVDHKFQLDNDHSIETVIEWIHVIKHLASSKAPESLTIESIRSSLPIQKKLLVLINPAGGSGRAVKIFRSKPRELFLKAGIEFEEVVTTHASHARNIARDLPLNKYDIVVTVGGDGFLTEVIQGFMDRKDWAQAIRHPVGIIPGGSGNGLSKSLLEASDEAFHPLNAAYLLAKGYSEEMDIATTRTNKQVFYSFLSLEWAYIANVDLESERYRCLGGARFLISAITTLFSRKVWRGRLSYLPSTDDNTEVMKYWDNTHSGVDEAPRLQLLNHLDSDIPDTWKTIDGEFSLFWGMSCAHAATDAHIAPGASVSDGYMHLVIVAGKVSLCDMTNILLGWEAGSHINHRRVQVIRTRAFCLEPSPGDLVAVDGERFDTAKTQVEVHRAMARIVYRPTKSSSSIP